MLFVILGALSIRDRHQIAPLLCCPPRVFGRVTTTTVAVDDCVGARLVVGVLLTMPAGPRVTCAASVGPIRVGYPTAASQTRSDSRRRLPSVDATHTPRVQPPVMVRLLCPSSPHVGRVSVSAFFNHP